MGSLPFPGGPGSLGLWPSPFGNSGNSDASFSFDAPLNAAPRLLLRQYSVGSVATGSFTSGPGNHAVSEGLSSFPGVDTWGWTPCTASFNADTLAGSLLVCIGFANADFFGGTINSPILIMDIGEESWGPPGQDHSIFTAGIPCTTWSWNGLAPVANGVLGYRVDSPIVAAGRQFYGGVNTADWCNNFAYQMILAEFASDNATIDVFSFNNTSVASIIPPGAPRSLTGRLPSDNPSFVISLLVNNPGNSAVAGSGFTLGPASSLGSQWQWQVFAAQPTGYASPQLPGSCPGLSGSFELGFSGVAPDFTQLRTFVWNLHAGTGGGGGGGGIFQPNVSIVV